MSPRTFLALILCLSTLQPAYGASAWSQLNTLAPSGEAPAGEGLPAPADLGAALKASVEKAAAERPLFQVTETAEGARTRRMLVIHRAQLEKLYLLSSTIIEGPSDRGMTPMMDETSLVSFRLTGDRVLLVERQTGFRADPGTPERKAIERSATDVILAVLPVISSDTANSYVTISADKLFLADVTKMQAQMKLRYQRGSAAYVAEASAIESLKAYPKNVNARVQLIFNVNPEPTLAPDTIIPIVMGYSITALPEDNGYEPRAATTNVGYFTNGFQNLSNPALKHKRQPVEELINRWDLRKKDPTSEVSEPVKPITFWLEDTIPEQYRPAIKAGILAWNAAFEAAGFRNAVVVKEVDKDMTAEQRLSFDPADISYNTVRWFVGNRSSWAVGPSRTNPLTGEIFHASISVGDMMSRLVDDLSLVESSKGHQHTSACRHEGAARNAGAMLQLMQNGGAGSAEVKKYVDDYMTELIAHEVGHTLGLRHNFRGSTAAKHLAEPANSTTVMDYSLPDLSGKSGSYYLTKVGEYDKFAIEWGYRPASKQELARIAARADADPVLAYDSDEVADGIDRNVRRFDTTDPKGLTALARGTFRRLEADGDMKASDLRTQFNAGIKAYWIALDSVLPVIGGMDTSRREKGPQFTPVPAADQRQALQFLESEIFSADALKVSPQLLSRIGNERISYRGNDPYPLADTVSQMQQEALSHLYDRETLKRLTESELYGGSAGRFTPSEMMDRVRRSIWSEVAGAKPASIPLQRRTLQSEHLKRLTAVLGSEDVPADAQAAARRDVERIVRDLKKSLAAAPDETTRLHLQTQLKKAQDALDGDKGKS